MSCGVEAVECGREPMIMPEALFNLGMFYGFMFLMFTFGRAYEADKQARNRKE